MINTHTHTHTLFNIYMKLPSEVISKLRIQFHQYVMIHFIPRQCSTIKVLSSISESEWRRDTGSILTRLGIFHLCSWIGLDFDRIAPLKTDVQPGGQSGLTTPTQKAGGSYSQDGLCASTSTASVVPFPGLGAHLETCLNHLTEELL